MWKHSPYHELFKRFARTPFRAARKGFLSWPSLTTALPNIVESNAISWALPEVTPFPNGTLQTWTEGNQTKDFSLENSTNRTVPDLNLIPNITGYIVVQQSYDFLTIAAYSATALILGLIILATIIGNVFVISSILLEKNLQSVANYLILSLAVADLLVACLVMPLGVVYEVSREWTLGPELCDIWTSSDVLCCTASILHLVAIALDRFWAVTRVDYIQERTGPRIGLMIVIIWSVSFMVCIAPLLGWKDPAWEERIMRDRTCLVSQDIGYQIFATASSFYMPLLVILYLYWRIFQVARKRIRRKPNALSVACGAARNNFPGGVAAGLSAAGVAGGAGGIAAAVTGLLGRPLPTVSDATTTTTALTNASSNNSSPERRPNYVEADAVTVDVGSSLYPPTPTVYQTPSKSKNPFETKRERKAAKTLAIITGVFVICWLPFFIMAILLPVYKVRFPPYVVSLFLWLGYFNSTINPIIYTIFNPEFRHAFKRLFYGRSYAIRRRNRRLAVRHVY